MGSEMCIRDSSHAVLQRFSPEAMPPSRECSRRDSRLGLGPRTGPFCLFDDDWEAAPPVNIQMPPPKWIGNYMVVGERRLCRVCNLGTTQVCYLCKEAGVKQYYWQNVPESRVACSQACMWL